MLKQLYVVRCKVLMAASLKVTVLCDVAPCSLVEIGRFRGAYSLLYYGGSTHP
jgi:hypothetical protein